MKRAEKRYGDRVAVAPLDLDIAEGETFCLVGESGCGKTTTLRLINRLTEVTSGTIEVFGEDISRVHAPSLRRNIGYVIQDAGLFAHSSIRDNVAVVPKLLGWDPARIRRRVEELLETVGLPEDMFGHRYPRQLSGGQRQRVGIARALAADPPLVLLDEPFGALDPPTRERMQDEFLALSQRVRKTFVIVTHDIFEAVRLGDRIGVMQQGELIRCGTPRELVADPGHPFVDAMLGRHRYQLRLMTVALHDVVHAALDDDLEGPTMELDASVWDALNACEIHNSRGVRVMHDGRCRGLGRTRLLAAVNE